MIWRKALLKIILTYFFPLKCVSSARKRKNPLWKVSSNHRKKEGIFIFNILIFQALSLEELSPAFIVDAFCKALCIIILIWEIFKTKLL